MAPPELAARGPSAPAAGRTSGRPCSCAEWRATFVQTNREPICVRPPTTCPHGTARGAKSAGIPAVARRRGGSMLKE